MRYDPDGNEKRRARKGEESCRACEYRCSLRVCAFPYARCHWDAGNGGSYDRDECSACQGARCRADDYAGDCKHFTARKA